MVHLCSTDMMSRLFEQAAQNPNSALNIWADKRFGVLEQQLAELRAEIKALCKPETT